MLMQDEIEIPLNDKIKKKVSQYANYGGGIYRMNSPEANCYEFTPFKNKEGIEDFVGSHHWTHSKSTHFSYVYDMTTCKFYTAEKFNKKYNHE